MSILRRVVTVVLIGLAPIASHAVTVIEADAYVDVERGELVRPAVIVIDGVDFQFIYFQS